MRRGDARRVLGLVCATMAFACNGPHYVSLGWNDAAVHVESSAIDAGAQAFGGEAASGDFARANERDSSQACAFGPARLALPGSCDARPFAACPDLGELPELTLDAVLSSVLRECGEIENMLTVSFERGCPIAFELGSDAAALAAAAANTAASDTSGFDAGPSEAAAASAAVSRAELLPAASPDAGALDAAVPGRASTRRCIAERLSARRFECARDIACGHGINFAPLTR